MSWPLLLKYQSCPAPSSPVHVSGWWGRARPAAGRKAGVFAGTRAQAQRWGSSGIHHGHVPSGKGQKGALSAREAATRPLPAPHGSAGTAPQESSS